MTSRMTGNVASWNTPHHVGVWAAVGAAHLLAAWALSSSTLVARTSPMLEPLITTLIMTNNPARASVEPPPLVQNVVVLQDPADPMASLPAPPVMEFAESNGSAVSVAPQLLDREPPDVAPFAKQAGLLPGESAVVVLRINVLPDGQIGDIQVDVSSGSDQVDRAAMAYARQLAWLPGRLYGNTESTWVRFGVRLAA